MKKSTVAIISVLCTFVVCLGAFCTYLVFNDETKQEKTNLKEEIQEKTHQYEKSSVVYVKYTGEDSYETENDLAALRPRPQADTLAEKTYLEILNSNQVRSKIAEQYPDIKYTIKLHKTNDTDTYSIIVRSDKEEHSIAICNLATNIFKEKVMAIINGVDCKVLDYAR